MPTAIGGACAAARVWFQRGDVGEQGARAGERVARVRERRHGHAEGRHHAVAEILVERALVPEHVVLDAVREFAQHAHHRRRQLGFGEGGEAADIDEQHRHVLDAVAPRRLEAGRDQLDDARREEPREIAALVGEAGLLAPRRERDQRRDRRDHEVDLDDQDRGLGMHAGFRRDALDGRARRRRHRPRRSGR